MSNKNQSLQQLLAERVSIFANSGKPAEMIDAGIEKLFKGVVDDAFRSYGDMGKAVKDAVKAALPANISDMFELTRYNALIANALRAQWASSGLEADMIRRANEALQEALKDEVIPARVSLRELLELFTDDHQEEAAMERWENPEIRFEDSEYGGMSIFFDKKPEESHRSSGLYRDNDRRHDYALKNRIHVRWDKKDQEKDEHGHSIGEVYSAQIEDNPIGRDFHITRRWERLIAALYFDAAKLVIDCDADEFSYRIYG